MLGGFKIFLEFPPKNERRDYDKLFEVVMNMQATDRLDYITKSSVLREPTSVDDQATDRLTTRLDSHSCANSTHFLALLE
jgi:hypothetical protein